MLEKGQISAQQMMILIYPTIIATAILLVPAITGKYAKQDMWLSPIWASVTGFLTVYIAHLLNKRFPKQTVIQYSSKITGPFLGKLIGLMILFFYLYTNGLILREYGEFIVGNFMTKTPMVVVIASMTVVCSLSVRGGLEVIARSAQIFVPVVIFLFLFIVILLIPDLDPNNIFPIMEHGATPSLMGAFVPASWFTEFFLIAFLFPYLGKQEKGLKWGMISVFAVMATMVLTNTFSLLLFGGITATFTYPVMSAARYISIAEFLHHLESIVMAIWVAGTFIKISVFYYAIVLGTAQWLNLSDYRGIVLPIGFLLVIFSLWSAPNLSALSYSLSHTWPFYAFFMQIFVPSLLLIVAMIKNQSFHQSA